MTLQRNSKGFEQQQEPAQKSSKASGKATPIPELEPTCGSWVVTSPGGRVVELYERANVEKAAEAGWRIETSAGYLARINDLIRAGALA